MTGDGIIRVATWNVFHLMDESLGRPGLRAGLRRAHRRVGDLVHLNRRHLRPAAMVLGRLDADVCLLQEIAPRDVPRLGRAVGAHGAWATRTGPLVGPAWLRDAVGAWNPDLVGTHEGNANAIVVGRRMRLREGSGRGLRLNPWRHTWDAWHDPATDLTFGGFKRWLGEARFAVAGRVSPGTGFPDVTVVSLHLHNARGEAERAHEIGRLVGALEGVEGPLIVGGDFNMPPSSPHMARLAEIGLADDSDDPSAGIDRVFTRGMDVVEPSRRLAPATREVRWTGRRGSGLVRVSDHDVVTATFRVPRAS